MEEYFERKVFMKIIDTLVEELALRRIQRSVRKIHIPVQIPRSPHGGAKGNDSHFQRFFLIETNPVGVFPNTHVALRIFQSMAVGSCSTERSFSCLKRMNPFYLAIESVRSSNKTMPRDSSSPTLQAALRSV